jgi:putative intracellular protease/amidase
LSFPATLAVLQCIDAANGVDIPLAELEIHMNATQSLGSKHKTLFLSLIAAVAAHASIAAPAEPQPVLLVIANQDFHHAEYAAARASLEARGLPVMVAAGESRLARPQGVRTGNAVRPDTTMKSASADDYSAIVFVGGWGASSYQYAFEGTYHNTAYRPQPEIADDVNRLIKAFTQLDKPVAAISHGVSVLAWARVEGVSPLKGRVIVGPAGGTPAFQLGGIVYPDAEQPMRWQTEFNGAIMLTSGSIGNPLSTADDVVVDGKIITAENYDSAARFAEIIAQSVAANRD